jgi:hypothetical protein
LKQSTKSLDLAFEPGAADFEVVALGFDVFELGLEGAHLVDALLTVAARGHCVGFAFFDFGDFGHERTGLGAGRLGRCRLLWRGRDAIALASGGT